MKSMAVIPISLQMGVQRFFRWWIGELAACLPARVRALVERERERLVVEISETDATFSHGKGDALRRLGTVSLASVRGDGTPPSEQRDQVDGMLDKAGLRSVGVSIRLPRDKVLRRLVELPVAAAENLREVLGFEMDRHTPFRAGEVYYDFRIKASDARRKRITVDLVVVPKAVVDPIARLAAAWRLDLDRIEVPGGPENGEPSFDLLPPRATSPGRTVGQRLNVALAALAVVLLFVAAYAPLEEKQKRLAATEASLARVQAEAAAVDAMRQQLADLVTRSRFAVEQKRDQRTVTEVLDEVTRVLPDHTWALKFGVRDDRLSVSGYSAKPSALISALEELEALAEVRFSSPVTMDQRVGSERFNLSARITGRGQQ